MLDYTTTISDDLTQVTLVFSTEDIDVTQGSITEKLTNRDILYETNGDGVTISFVINKDEEYVLYFLVNGGYSSSYLLINSRAILCSNKKNRQDVTAYMKVKKLDNTSKITDCLNRVIIANHRLGHYQRAAEILKDTNTNCEGTCEC